MFRIEVEFPKVAHSQLHQLLQSPEGTKLMNPDIDKHKATILGVFEGDVLVPKAQAPGQDVLRCAVAAGAIQHADARVGTRKLDVFSER